MQIVEPKVTIIPFDVKGTLMNIERAARMCYKTEGKMGNEPNIPFIKKRIDTGHLSVIEHEKISVIFRIDRGISHELVRHRISAFSQESTRYCNYSKDQFGKEITVIKPFFFWDMESYMTWREACLFAEKKYFELLQIGCSPQEARNILPNSLKTEIYTTFDIREWRHFFSLRTDLAAHPQMRQVAIPLLLKFKELLPVMFEDIPYDTSFSTRNYAEIVIGDI